MTIEAFLRQGGTHEDAGALFAAMWRELGECSEEEALGRLQLMQVRLGCARAALLEGRAARRADDDYGEGEEGNDGEDEDGEASAAGDDAEQRSYEAVLVQTNVDIVTTRLVVEAEDEEAAAERAMGVVSEAIEWPWDYVKRKFECTEDETVNEVPETTPLTAIPTEGA